MEVNMIRIILIILSLLIPLSSFANPQNIDETDQLIIFHIYNGERPVADSLLDNQIKIFPKNPKYFLLKCQNYFYSRYFNPGNVGGDSLLQLMHQSVQKAIEIAEKEKMSIDDKYYAGSAYGYVARFYGRRGDFWDAYSAADDARTYLNEVLEQDPTYTDAIQELAVQSYFTGRMTGYYGFLAWMIGMSGNRTEALQQFHEVAEQGKLSKAEARFVTFALYRFIENDQEQAELSGNQFLESFPNNPFVANQLAQMQFLALIESKGVDFLETEFDSLRSKYSVTNPNILNLLGYNFLNQGRFDEAIKVHKVNIRLYPDLANGYDSLSEAYELSGNAEMAIKNAKICLEILPSDSTITEDFRELVRQSSEDRLEVLGVDIGKLNI